MGISDSFLREPRCGREDGRCKTRAAGPIARTMAKARNAADAVFPPQPAWDGALQPGARFPARRECDGEGSRDDRSFQPHPHPAAGLPPLACSWSLTPLPALPFRAHSAPLTSRTCRGLPLPAALPESRRRGHAGMNQRFPR